MLLLHRPKAGRIGIFDKRPLLYCSHKIQEKEMSIDVAEWLKGLGLERYERAFRENEIDWEALSKLTAEDLKDIGVVLGGHRRRLLDAIAALDTAEASPPATAAPAFVGEAERRQLAVMFCDLVGSTPL
jgi:hypothetical protein